MKCRSQMYKQWKSDLNTFWECFMYYNSELSCWNFNEDFILPYLLQWIMIYSFGINTDLGIDPNSITYTVMGDIIRILPLCTRSRFNLLDYLIVFKDTDFRRVLSTLGFPLAIDIIRGFVYTGNGQISFGDYPAERGLWLVSTNTVHKNDSYSSYL